MKKIICLILLCLSVTLLPKTVIAQTADLINGSNIYNDELNPVDGVYKVSSLVGIENIANHLDGTFEIINDIDLNGATLKPIGDKANPFTGSIICGEHIISNFEIKESNVDGDLGFIAYNKGLIDKLFLEDVRLIADENTINVGLLVSENHGTISRCNVAGTFNLEKVKDDCNIGGLVGINEGTLKNSIAKLEYTSSIDEDKKMTIGGIVGTNKDGSVRDCETYADLVIDNAQNKNIGLLVGKLEKGDVKRCVFMGENNKVEGTLFETTIGVKSNSATAATLLVRQNGIDDVSKESRELRNIVVDYMYQMGSVLWTTPEQIQSSCVQKCSSQQCHTPLDPGTIYRGFPYKHSSSTLDRMLYCLDENNELKQWVVDLGNIGGYQTYFGSACYSSVQLAWSRVSNTVNATCAMEALLYGKYTGTIGIGTWSDAWEYKLNDQYTQKCIDLIGIDAVLEDYALVRAGDCFIKLNSGGAHAIMAASDVVVVRDENGKIDPDHSYLYTHEQGGPNNAPDGIVSSWCLDRYKTFTTLLGEAFLPLTIQELIDGKMDEVEVKLEGGCDGRLGLTTGVVSSNYYIDALTINIEENGKEFFNKKVYCRVDNIKDYDGSVAMFDRNFVKEYDLALLTKSLQNIKFNSRKHYHATLTLLLQTGEEIIVKDFEF